MRKLRFYLLSIFALLCCISASAQAYDFEVDCLKYHVDYDTSTEATVIGYTDEIPADVIIPATVNYGYQTYNVTAIGDNAFSNCSNIVSIDMNSVEKIGNLAFDFCFSLTSVNLGQVTSIGQCAFRFCSGLSSIDLKDVQTIGEQAFNGCSFSSIDFKNVISVESRAFYGCNNLTSINLKHVNNIGAECFAQCFNLNDIKTSEIEPPFINENTFDSWTQTSAVLNVPSGAKDNYTNHNIWGKFNTIEETPILYVSSNGGGIVSFLDLSILNNVHSVEVPKGTYITLTISPLNDYCIDYVKMNEQDITSELDANKYSFTMIADVNIEVKFSKIQIYEFEENGIKYKVDYNKSKTEATVVGYHPFNMPANVIIPSTVSYDGNSYEVTSIASYVFNNCKSLNSIDFGNVKTIGEEAFSSCPNLSSIDLGNVSTIGDFAFNRCESLNKVDFKNVENIGRNAFEGCSNITILDLRNVKTIGEQSFKSCYSLTYVDFNNVTSIGVQAFMNCVDINSIDLHNVLSIGSYAFVGCDKITAVSTKKIEAPSIEENTFESGVYTNAKLYIPKSSKDNYKAHMVWRKFQNIEEHLCEGSDFYQFEKDGLLFQINLDKSTPEATVIGYTYEMPADVVIPETVTYNGITAGVTTIGDKAFSYYPKLKSINLKNVTTIGYQSFYVCSGLETVDFGSVETIKDEAFTFDYSIKTIDLKNVSTIGAKTFYSCTGLETIDFRNVHTIGENSFLSCHKLTTIDLKNVKVIGKDAFKSCQHINPVITSETETPSIDPSSFEAEIYNNSVLFVPTGSKQNYLNHGVWAKFSDIREYEDVIKYILSVETNNGGSVSFKETVVTNGVETYEIKQGEQVALTFTANDGYKLSSVMVDGSDVTADVINNTYTVTMDKDIDVVAKFEEIKYTLSVTSDNGGSVSFNDITVTDGVQTAEIKQGEQVTLTFTPNDGYKLSSVMVNGNDVTADVIDNTYTITMDKDINVVVSFEEIKYTLSVTSDNGGSVSFNDITVTDGVQTAEIKQGEQVTLTFTPNDGYKLSSVMVNGNDVTADVIDNTYTVTMDKDIDVVVKFEEIKYTLSVTSDNGGSVSFNDITVTDGVQTAEIKQGEQVTLTFTPNDGYKLSSVMVNGNDVTAEVIDNTYTVTMDKDIDVVVKFEEIKYTLSVTSDNGGSVSFNDIVVTDGTQTSVIKQGEQVALTFTANDGYKLSSVMVDGSDVTADVIDNTYTVTMDKDIDVVVAFEEFDAGIMDITYNGISVRGYKGYIIVSGTKQGDTVKVYSRNGALVTSKVSEGFDLKVILEQRNVYFVKVSGKTFKIAL